MIDKKKLSYDRALVDTISERMRRAGKEDEGTRVIDDERYFREKYNILHLPAIMLAAGKNHVDLTELLGPPGPDGEEGRDILKLLCAPSAKGEEKPDIFDVTIHHSCLGGKYVEPAHVDATVSMTAFHVVITHPDISGFKVYHGLYCTWDYVNGNIVFPANYPNSGVQKMRYIVEREGLYAASLYTEAWLIRMAARKLERLLVEQSGKLKMPIYQVSPAPPASVLQGAFPIDPARAIQTRTCVFCSRPGIEFKTERARREYDITGMCQACQDDMFGDERWTDRCSRCGKRVPKPGLCGDCAGE